MIKTFSYQRIDSLVGVVYRTNIKNSQNIIDDFQDMLLSTTGETYLLNKFGTAEYFQCSSSTYHSVLDSTNVLSNYFAQVSNKDIKLRIMSKFWSLFCII